MKRVSSLILALLIAASLLAACGRREAAAPAASAGADTQAAPVLPEKPPEPESPLPEPQPAPHAPEELFGEAFNPFYQADFPESFQIYAALFTYGNPKLGGGGTYVLSLVAQGPPAETIAFLAELAGIGGEADSLTGAFNKDGFCQFESAPGAVFTLRKTDRNDDRYAYVEGCHIDLSVPLADGDTAKFQALAGDNFNIKALGPAADYFDATPVFNEYDVYVNRHQMRAEVSLRFDVGDAGELEKKMAAELQTAWYDAGQSRLGLTWGMMDLTLSFNKDASHLYVSERTADLQSPISAYTAPLVSFATLGFYYAQADGLCLYEDKKTYTQLAVSRPEWEGAAAGWNMEFLQEQNGYLLAVWYHEEAQKYVIQADKDGAASRYEYDIATGRYGGEYPDADAVQAVFGAIFDTGEDARPRALSLLEETVNSRFGLTPEALYALPIR